MNLLYTRLKKLVYVLVRVFLGGDRSARLQGVKVGRNCRIYPYDFGTEPFLISIGDNVTITAGVKILTHDGSSCLVVNSSGRRYQFYGKVTIGNNVFIGVNTLIMPGVTIGSNVVIGAGSVVTKDIGDNVVVAGNPAKQISGFEEFSNKMASKWVNDSELESASHYSDRVLRACNIIESRNK